MPAVWVIFALLPVTYGTGFLQEIVLRGRSPDLPGVLPALEMADARFLIAWWRLRRLMARE